MKLKKERLISDVKITDIMGLPRSTIQDFKNRESNDWRYKVYHYIKSKSEEELKEFVNLLDNKEMVKN